MMKKLFAIIMSMLMIACFMPTMAFADGDAASANYITINDDNTHYNTFADAVNAAKQKDGTITYHIYGKIDAEGSDQWINFVKNRENVTSVKFVGMTENAEISVVSSQSILGVQGLSIDVSFEHLKLTHPDGAWVNDLGHATNYFSCMVRDAKNNTVTYTDCVFPDGVCDNMYGKTVFTNCKFTNSTNGKYNLWNYGGNTTVTNCVFTGTRGIKLYNEGTKENPPTISVKDTTFNGLTEKPALVVSKPAGIGLENTTVTGCEKGLLIRDITNNSEIKLNLNGTNIGATFDITAATTSENEYKSEIKITGGTFTSSPEKYLDSILEVVQQDDGTFTVAPNENAVAQVGSAYYATLQEAVTAAKDGQEVQLLKSCEGPGIFMPASSAKAVIINFDNNTYTVNSLVGSSTTVNQALHLEKGNNVVLKNGTIKISEAQQASAKIMIQNYCDLTVESMTLDGSGLKCNNQDRYVISNNDGVVTVKDSTVIASKYAEDNRVNVAIDAAIWGGYAGADVAITNSTVLGSLEVAKYEYDSSKKEWIKTEDVAKKPDGRPCIKVESGEFTDIENAVAVATDNAVIKLAENVTITKTINVEKDLTLDLNGKTLTSDGIRAIHVKSGNLVLTGEGTVTSVNVANPDSSVIRVGGTTGLAKLTVDKDVTVEAPSTYGVTVFGEGSEEVIINGKIHATVESGQSALSGNGSAKYNAEGTTTKITIGETAELTSKGVAIYHPNEGTLTIDGATIIGDKGGIEAKGGNTTIGISGNPTITSNASETAHNPNNNGPSTSGYAIAIVENSQYAGGATVTIKNGTYTGAIGILEDSTVADDKKGSISISGGTFTADPTPYVTEDYKASKGSDGKWTVAKKSSSSGGGSGSSTATTLDKVKAETNTALSNAAAASKYDDAEQAEVKSILEKAAADIKAAKTEAEVKAIQEAAQAEIDKVLTSEEKAEIEAVTGVSSDIFKAKSKYSKLNGKRAIKVTWNVPGEMKLDGYEVFRSTSRYSGFGKTPYFTTSKTSYTNNKELKTGKTYYYKVRGFVEINGVKYYTKFSTKAYRVVR